MRIVRPRLATAALFSAFVLLPLTACRSGELLTGGGTTDPDGASRSETAEAELPAVGPSAPGDVRVHPGASYAGDDRFDALAADWPQRVQRALERLAVVTGLAFDAEATPQVVLTSLGDERIPYELRAEVRNGRRRVRLYVNAEPVLGGVADADRVLLRALGAAAFEDAARRHGAVPRWLIALAGTAAAGDLEERLVTLRRTAHEGDPDVLRVDPGDATVAEATSLAALLLLSRGGEPGEVRRLLRFVADGDSADEVLGRLARQPDGRWDGPARLRLRERLAAISPEPWQVLRAAEEALAESGRAGLDAVLVGGVPAEIADEVTVLRARAAAAEGDHEQARALLRRLAPRAAARLRDPATALALRIRVESRRGGDQRLARKWAGQLDRDFPRSPARAALRRDHPLLGMEEDPQRWLAVMRTRVDRLGTDGFDLATIERYARTLLQDHRAGAAERLLWAIGDRGTAPELADVRFAVAEAQSRPGEAARHRNRTRVAAWRRQPTAERAADVREGGRASVNALAALLEPSRTVNRRAVVSMLVATAGGPGTVALLVRAWSTGRGRPRADLEHLLAAMPYAILRAELPDRTLRQVGIANPGPVWAQLRFGLDPAWLADHPRFLADMRSGAYAVRRAAFDLVAAAPPGTATPGVVARGLRDPAALLRQEAVRVAGGAGFSALARRGLEDEVWLVRAEACRVVAALEGLRAVTPLVERLREDEAIAVRTSAATALLRIAPQAPDALDALLATQVDEDPRLQEVVATGMAELDRMAVARAVARAWSRAVRRPKPHRGFLFRSALLFQRVSQVDLGYFPGATSAELQAMWQRMRRWIAARAAREPAPPSGRSARAPTGNRSGDRTPR